MRLETDKPSIYIVVDLILVVLFSCFKFNALFMVGPVKIPQQGNALNIIFPSNSDKNIQ